MYSEQTLFLGRAGSETCTVHERRLVWRYLPLGPWACHWVFEKDAFEWRGEFLCSEMPLGNSGEWRTLYFKGLWLLPRQDKNAVYSILAPRYVDSLEVIQLITVLEDLTLGKSLSRNSCCLLWATSRGWGVACWRADDWGVCTGTSPVRQGELGLASSSFNCQPNRCSGRRLVLCSTRSALPATSRKISQHFQEASD